jgi:hypothetical protein
VDEALRRVLWRLLYQRRPIGRSALKSLLSGRRSATLRDALQDTFSEYVRRLARLASLGEDDKWIPRADRAIRNHMVAQRALALRKPPLPGDLMDMAERLQVQQGFMTRFQNEVLATPVANRSEAAIGARMQLYSGAGRAEWFRGEEEDQPRGTVVDYEALDDNSTCFPCLMAEQNGPYAPEQGPFPGEVCLGRGSCRCKRLARFSPVEARSLGIPA